MNWQHSFIARIDLPEVLKIDPEWDEQTYLAVLKHRVARVARCPIGHGIVGVVVYGATRRLQEVDRLLVDPQYRRCGVGTAMLRDLAALGLRKHRPWIAGWVGEADLASQIWLRDLGAQAVCTEGDQYRFVLQSRVLANSPVARSIS
jgi:GNAT superfamily N-acetyltransferase